MTVAKILIVDDERSMRQLLQCILCREKYDITLAASAKEAIEIVQSQSFDLIVQDMVLPDIHGIELLQRLKQLCPQVVIVIITAVAGWQTAVEAMRIGAFDYIRKPFDNNNIQGVVARALKYKKLRETMPNHVGEGVQNIIGNSQQVQQVQEIIRRVAPTDSTVIIYGESGTGKELVARAIHLNSFRRENVFIPVNCGAISESLMESELFGHSKGAFTSASQDKKGLFEIADNGTMFFDEIGEMSLQTQVKLLRVLEDKQFIPLGATKSRQVDVRFITATNRDLEEQLRKGEFREDLYYRLNVIAIKLSPLRERKDDIPLLAGHFLALYASRLHKQVTQFSDEVMEFLLSYDWPGNVRELSNTIQRAVVMSESSIISKKDLQGYLQLNEQKQKYFSYPELPPQGFFLEKELENFEKHFIEAALKRTNGNLTNAAALLNLSFRSLRYKVKKYKINPGANEFKKGADHE